MSHAPLLLAMLIGEALLGYPRRWWHPVMGAGALLAAGEARLNRGAPARRRLAGVALLALLLGLAIAIGVGLERALRPHAAAAVLLVPIGMTGLAQRSLHDHVAAVLRPLRAGDLSAARTAVAMIVGRDVAALDEAGIATAAIESLAESFGDGVVTPACWYLVAGLPGLMAAKLVNTADSMLGHRTPRLAAFGWASARADDGLNLLPARLAGALLCLAGGGGWRTMARDAGRHASPNSGWPEAAMAGALARRLGGPVNYDGVPSARAVLGQGPAPDAADLARALRLYRRACGALWLLVGGVAWLA
ncbi:cobalamin biosynthesis protein CobD/CbiB [Sphingomonas morindae]|uniref:Cobalamin biosynthesis protein CobD n=1 Tax=Sphingomonas morindae TaxID=1541170 RepID=A0ABY4XBP4_9SPHN|nr:CobD/CbiB family cobalamin biosynthesis protein [Sphingomonas morindae]USI74318.1 cobalamin biosynthesis protein [Sphingomonas morindae]